MAQIVVTKDTKQRLMFPEETTYLTDYIEAVNQEFPEIPADVRYEQIVVEGPMGLGPEGMIFVEARKPTPFREDGKECHLPTYRTLAQIIECATLHQTAPLGKMRLVVPYGRPDALTIYIDE